MTVAAERREVEIRKGMYHWFAVGESAKLIRQALDLPGSMDRVFIPFEDFHDVKDTLLRRGLRVVI